jgi:hypothetical protein
MQASISTVLGNRRRHVKLKHDYEETVETGIDIISLAIIDRIR